MNNTSTNQHYLRTDAENIRGEDKKKKRTFNFSHLNINEVQSIGVKVGNRKNKSGSTGNVDNYKTEKNERVANNNIIPKSTVKGNVNILSSIKDYYLSTHSHGSPIKGRNLLINKGTRNTTPNNNSIKNNSLHNQTLSQSILQQEKISKIAYNSNSHSPFLVSKNQRGGKGVINSSNITSSTNNISTTSISANSKLMSNLTQYTNFFKKRETAAKFTDTSLLPNISKNACETMNTTKTSIKIVNVGVKSKSPLNRTINLSKSPNGKKENINKDKLVDKVDKLEIFNTLLKELIESGDKETKEKLRESVKKAYEILFQIEERSDKVSQTENNKNSDLPLKRNQEQNVYNENEKESDMSSISLEHQTDLYYSPQKEIKNPGSQKAITMPRLALGLSSIVQVKIKEKDNASNTNNTNNEVKSSIMKDNFLKDSGKTSGVLSNSTKPSSKVQQPSLLINLENLPRKDFNDEFMENADDFSPSWRNGCRKINLFKKKKVEDPEDSSSNLEN